MSFDDSFDYGGNGYENSYDNEFSFGREGSEDESSGEEQKSFGQEDEKSEGGEDPGEGLNFGETFADIERTKGGAFGEAFDKKGSKVFRTAEQAAIEKAHGILSGENMYSNVTDSEKKKIISLMEKVRNIERCSIEVLVPAFLFKVRKLDLKKDFQPFFKQLEGIEAPDLLRYIRQFEELK